MLSQLMYGSSPLLPVRRIRGAHKLSIRVHACLRRRVDILSTLACSLTSSAFLTPTSRQDMDEDYYTQQLHCEYSEASFKMRSPTH